MSTLTDIGKVITGIGSVIPGPWQPLAIAGSAALGAVDANQASQNQKGQLGAQQAQSAQQYAALAPFRNAANAAAGQAGAPQDFSADYYDPTNPYASGGNGQFTPITGRYSPLVDTAAQTVANAPDRSALVQSYLKNYDVQDAPRLAADLRTVGQKAASLGRIGAGMTTNELTGVEGAHDLAKQNFATGLINDAVANTLGDRIAQLSALRGANADDTSLAESNRAFNSAQGAQAVGYRAAQRNAEQGAQGAAAGRAATLANVGYTGGVNYAPMATYYGNQADTQTQGVNDLLQYLPLILNQKKPLAPTSTSSAPVYTE